MTDIVTNELRPVKEKLIDSLCEFLETGTMAINTNNEYVKANFKINELANSPKYGHILYDYYLTLITEYTIQTVRPSFNLLSLENLLSNFAQRWENHKILVFYVRKIFGYLDRYYVNDNKKLTLAQAGLNIFKNEIFDEVSDRVRIALIEEINKERDGKTIDRARVKSCLIGFSQMGLIESDILKVEESSEKRHRLV